jgi:hypothetical protein
MGEIVHAEFGKPLPAVHGMPKSAPEILNRLSVLMHDRNKIAKDLADAEYKLRVAQKHVDDVRADLGKVDEKMRDAQGLLVDDIRREKQVLAYPEGP